MRILYCNKYNFPFSGTEVYLFQAMELMRSQGHEVALFSMLDERGTPSPFDRHFMPKVDFKTKGKWLHKARLAARAIYSVEARRRIRAMIAEFRPDVAHVRNIYHHLSPSILWELKAQKVPVLYHLNDFKVLCPSYNLVAQGEPCEACKGGRFWRAMERQCYPGTAERLTLIAEAYFHRLLGTYRSCVDCFLAPSQFVKDKFVEHGWDPSRFAVLPHFQTAQNEERRDAHSSPVLYFGRLSREKGVEDLLRAMHRLPDLRLTVAGDGPERGSLEQLGRALELRNVEFVGPLRGFELHRAITDSRFTVLPSHAYETLGKTILESHAQARAVVASDLGSRRELIEHGKTGLLYKTGDVPALASAIEFLSDHPAVADAMGRAGQKRVRDSYTPEAHYRALIGLYEQLVNGHRHFPVGLAGATMGPKPAAAHLQLKASGKYAPAAAAPLRIAFIGGRGVDSKYSGIETYYEEVGGRLAAMGHEVTAYCRSYFTPEMMRHKGMRVVRLPTIRSKHLETLLHTFLSTAHAVLQPYDIVHYHALGPALFSFLPRLVGKKTVVTVQGLDWQRKKWGRIASAVLRLGEKAAVRMPTSTVVVSQTLQAMYRDRYGAECAYVPNGGILRPKRPAEKILEWGIEPNRYILFLGRFSPEKGCHLLIEAYEKINTELKLVLAGASSYCDDYARELRSHANERIRILDWVSGDALDELMTNAMVFVLPSDLEGLSLALLDAMGAGLCVLASDVPENREALAETGFTFRRGDPFDLADRLKFLISNPAVREASGASARRRVRESYQWSGVAESMEQVYFKMMDSTPQYLSPKKPGGRATLPSADSGRKKAS
jgi:glycosyltransferase involved in cell wall biosynthesis